jgi:hypothetical protein
MIKHNILGILFQKRYNNIDNIVTVCIFAVGLHHGLLIGCLVGVIVGTSGLIAEKLLCKRYKIKQTVIFSTEVIAR